MDIPTEVSECGNVWKTHVRDFWIHFSFSPLLGSENNKQTEIVVDPPFHMKVKAILL